MRCTPLTSRLVICLLTLGLALINASASDPPATGVVVNFKVKGSFARYEGEVTEFNDQWFRLRTTDGLDIQFYWAEVVDADADHIKKAVGLITPPSTEKLALTEAGVKVTRLADKSEYLGKELPEFSTPEYIVIKSRGERYKFPRKEVIIESKLLSVKDIYSEKELYEMLQGTQVPRTAREHLQMAELCSFYGLRAKAEEHYRFYELLAQTDLPEGRLAEYLNRLRESYPDTQLKEELYLMSIELMDEEYSKAIERLNRLEKNLGDPNLLLELREVRRQIESARQVSINTRIVAAWMAVLRSLLRTKATDRSARFSECINYATADVMRQAAARVAQRVGMEADSVRQVWNKRPGDNIGIADYGRGTWLVEMPETGNIEEWWSEASNTERFNVLLGVCAEQNLRVVLITHKNCPTCGGTGRVKPADAPLKFPSTGRCLDCMGLGRSRVIVYR